MEKNNCSEASTLSTPQQRRKFLGWVAAGAGLFAGGGLVGWKWLFSAPSTALPSRADFAGQLNSSFAVRGDEMGTRDDAPVARLELIEVTEEKVQQAGKRSFKSFNLYFKGPQEGALTQQTCSIDHPKLGKMQLFLVPVGKPKDGVVKYEAVFSLFV